MRKVKATLQKHSLYSLGVLRRWQGPVLKESGLDRITKKLYFKPSFIFFLWKHVWIFVSPAQRSTTHAVNAIMQMNKTSIDVCTLNQLHCQILALLLETRTVKLKLIFQKYQNYCVQCRHLWLHFCPLCECASSILCYGKSEKAQWHKQHKGCQLSIFLNNSQGKRRFISLLSYFLTILE